jgi:lipid-binding SYLF domain-containing protein
MKVRVVKALLIVLALVGFGVSVMAVEKAVLEGRVRKLAFKFEAMQRHPLKRIPAGTLRAAQGIILLDRIKAGFIFAFQGGSGVAMVRDHTSGQWGPAAFMSANEASLGFQIGSQQSFIVILLMTTNATRQLLEPTFDFGGEARGTAGDASAGTEAVITSQEQAMLVYDDRQGLYAGAAIRSGSLAPDPDANLAYYGQSLTMRDILLDHKVKPTWLAAELAQKIDQPAPMLTDLGKTTPYRSRPKAIEPKPSLSTQSARPLNPHTNLAVEQLQILMADLNAGKQTNAIEHLNQYLSAMITTEHSADAGMTVAILERLRSGRTAEAIELLELQLDGAVTGLGASLAATPRRERPASALSNLKSARQYRNKFPRKTGDRSTDDGVERAWGLLEGTTNAVKR